MSCVYKLTFPNGAVYIGKTNRNPEDRWMNGWGYKRIPQVFNAILMYGWLNVEKEIIVDNVSETIATRIEIEQINKYALLEDGLAQSDLHSTFPTGGSAQHFFHRVFCTEPLAQKKLCTLGIDNTP